MRSQDWCDTTAWQVDTVVELFIPCSDRYRVLVSGPGTAAAATRVRVNDHTLAATGLPRDGWLTCGTVQLDRPFAENSGRVRVSVVGGGPCWRVHLLTHRRPAQRASAAGQPPGQAPVPGRETDGALRADRGWSGRACGGLVQERASATWTATVWTRSPCRSRARTATRWFWCALTGQSGGSRTISDCTIPILAPGDSPGAKLTDTSTSRTGPHTGTS